MIRDILGISRGQRRLVLLLITVLSLPGCSYLMRQKADRLSQDFTSAILQQEDAQTVADAFPAYLLLMDTLVQNSPDNGSLLMADARLKATYAASFLTEPPRQKLFADQAWDLARRSVCLEESILCDAHEQPTEAITSVIDWEDPEQVKAVYDFASVWINWIQCNKEDWNAIAQLARAQQLMLSVATHEPAIDNGNAFVYLGVMNSLVPAALGGKPETGRDYFEKALNVTQGQNLMAKVLYAEFYARLTFDQALHDRLIDEVLNATTTTPSLRLSNALAKRRAIELKVSGKDYF